MAPILLWASCIFGLAVAMDPPTTDGPVSENLLLDDLMLEIYGPQSVANARASFSPSASIDTAQFVPAPTDASYKEQQEESNCNADCQVQYSPVTVYEWQPVSITATSTIIKYIFTEVPVAESETIIRQSPQDRKPVEEEEGEFQTKNGLPYSALAVPVMGDDQNLPATKVVDVFYPTPVTVYPKSYSWEGNLMTQIGNPMIGMVWTCLRDVRTPIKGKLSPVNGQDIWEFGNATSSVDPETLDNTLWKLVPALYNLEQNFARELFPSDLALGYCKVVEELMQPETTSVEYGIRYITITSTLSELNNQEQPTPLIVATPVTSAATAPNTQPTPDSIAIKTPAPPPQASPISSSKPLPRPSGKGSPCGKCGHRIRTENTAWDLAPPPLPTGGPDVEVVRTEQKATHLVKPQETALPEVAESSRIVEMPTLMTPVAVVAGRPQSEVQGSPTSAVSAKAGIVQPMPNGAHGTHAPDPIISFGKPQKPPKAAPLIISDHVLVPQAGNTFVAEDGQKLVRDGPAISLSVSDQNPDRKMMVNLVSGTKGKDVLVVDGISQTIGAPAAATGLPFIGYGYDGYDGYDYDDSSYPSGKDLGDTYSGPGSFKGGASPSKGGSQGETSSNLPGSLGKVRPAVYQGAASILRSDLLKILFTSAVAMWYC